MEYAAVKLTEYGYTPVKPITAGYSGSILHSGDGDSDWGELIGRELLNKAVKHNFMTGIKLWEDKCWYGVEGGKRYHRPDCPHLLKAWRKPLHTVFYELIKDGQFFGMTPCKACKPNIFSEAGV
jgi:hypothetical protein